MLVRSLCVLVCGGLFTVAVGQSHSQSVDLMSDMLSGYDRRHRPVEDQSQAIQVSSNKYVYSLIDSMLDTF